jgi:hypothetical protein
MTPFAVRLATQSRDEIFYWILCLSEADLLFEKQAFMGDYLVLAEVLLRIYREEREAYRGVAEDLLKLLADNQD